MSSTLEVTRRVLLFLLLSAATLSAQTSPLIPRTFISADGRFTFSYPGSYTLYTSRDMEQSKVLFYIPPCTDGAIVCVTSQPKKYAGTNFGVASFEVMTTGAQSEGVCFTPRVKEDTPDFTPVKDRPYQVVNGVRFLRGSDGGAALGHWASTDVYRTFRNGKCYRIRTTIAVDTYGLRDPPGPKFTQADEREVRRSLNLVIDSFRFLK